MTQIPRLQGRNTDSKIQSLQHRSPHKSPVKSPARLKTKLPRASRQTEANPEPPKGRWAGPLPGGDIPDHTWPLTPRLTSRAGKVTQDWILSRSTGRASSKGKMGLFTGLVRSEMGEGKVELRYLLEGSSPSNVFAFLPELGAFTWRHLVGRLQALTSVPPAACRKADPQANVPQQATEKGSAWEYRILNFIPRSHHRDYGDRGRVWISGEVFAHKYRGPFFIRQMSENESNTSLGDKFAAQFFSGSSRCHGTLFESEA